MPRVALLGNPIRECGWGSRNAIAELLGCPWRLPFLLKRGIEIPLCIQGAIDLVPSGAGPHPERRP